MAQHRHVRGDMCPPHVVKVRVKGYGSLSKVSVWKAPETAGWKWQFYTSKLQNDRSPAKQTMTMTNEKWNDKTCRRTGTDAPANQRAAFHSVTSGKQLVWWNTALSRHRSWLDELVAPPTDTQTDKHTDRHTERQTDRHTDRQTAMRKTQRYM